MEKTHKNVPILPQYAGLLGTAPPKSLSYGMMPPQGENEISITPSLAKKFDNDIKQLMGKELTLKRGGRECKLVVSSILMPDTKIFCLPPLPLVIAISGTFAGVMFLSGAASCKLLRT